jgi:hypothetical protein
MLFNKISISDTYIDEVISSPSIGGDGALSITVHLDLTGPCPSSPTPTSAVKTK